MKFSAIAVFLVLAATTCLADDTPSELKAIEARYGQADLNKNEALREKYIMELATLRWRLVHDNQHGWQAVDAEIARHPAPSSCDTKALWKARVGTWHSPRHDYLYRADGTWAMVEPGIPDSTNGTWSIKNNRYSETPEATSETTTYTIILLDADTFIYAGPGPAEVYYETSSLRRGLPIRRDDSEL